MVNYRIQFFVFNKFKGKKKKKTSKSNSTKVNSSILFARKKKHNFWCEEILDFHFHCVVCMCDEFRIFRTRVMFPEIEQEIVYTYIDLSLQLLLLAWFLCVLCLWVLYVYCMCCLYKYIRECVCVCMLGSLFISTLEN